MLAQLGHLDPRLHCHGGSPDREIEPGGERVVVAAESTEQPTSLDRDPLGRPRRLQAARREPIPAGMRCRPADVGDAAAVPPRQAG